MGLLALTVVLAGCSDEDSPVAPTPQPLPAPSGVAVSAHLPHGRARQLCSGPWRR
jgi:hypothetical protein